MQTKIRMNNNYIKLRVQYVLAPIHNPLPYYAPFGRSALRKGGGRRGNRRFPYRGSLLEGVVGSPTS